MPAVRRSRDDSADAAAADRDGRVILVGLAALAGLIALGVAAVVRRNSSAGSSASPASSGTTPSNKEPVSSTATTPSPTTGPVILAANAVPIGGAAQATDPETGDPIYVLQLQPGVFSALDRICPHQDSEVSFISKAAGFECPCHLSTFDPSGAVTRGPAATGLIKVPVTRPGDQIVRA